MGKSSSSKYPIKASLVTYKDSLNNNIFNPSRRYNNARKYIYLKEQLMNKNIDLQTCDLNLPEDSFLSIHFDVHKDFLF